ncbi:MAG: methylated-DNA--[protein]-cysteine S-methyltransferase [Sulfuricellaceae bacterium]|nr:methylated-DNA--[protein]-cysteine S-methyltransferase [Sulfuricellaceae bacterium]
MKTYQAILPVPFGKLGILSDSAHLFGIDFLSHDAAPLLPQNPVAKAACQQLLAYLENSAFHFDLPIHPHGTLFQQRVWQALADIPCGKTETYGALASQLKSAALAIGQACGANPVPIVIPCHRVLGKRGLGGFMHHRDGNPLDIKRWLLTHERAQFPLS